MEKITFDEMWEKLKKYLSVKRALEQGYSNGKYTKILAQYAEEVVLSYDSDAAGQNAIMRGIDIMQDLGVICKVLQMTDAKDPDEYVLKFGPEKFNKLIDNSLTAVEYKIKMLKMLHLSVSLWTKCSTQDFFLKAKKRP